MVALPIDTTSLGGADLPPALAKDRSAPANEPFEQHLRREDASQRVEPADQTDGGEELQRDAAAEQRDEQSPPTNEPPEDRADQNVENSDQGDEERAAEPGDGSDVTAAVISIPVTAETEAAAASSPASDGLTEAAAADSANGGAGTDRTGSLESALPEDALPGESHPNTSGTGEANSLRVEESPVDPGTENGSDRRDSPREGREGPSQPSEVVQVVANPGDPQPGKNGAIDSTLAERAESADRDGKSLGSSGPSPDQFEGRGSPTASSAVGSERGDVASSRFASQLFAQSAGRSDTAPSLDSAQQMRFVERVARAFQAAEGRGGTVRLRLHPPELGGLRLELTVQNGALNARLETETSAARSLLLENLPVLRERLVEQGVRIEQFEVDLNNQRFGGAENGADQFDHPAPTDPTRPSLSHDDEVEDPPASPAQDWNSPDGQIDVIV